MFLLDTSVLLELARVSSGKANPRVLLWASALQTASLHLSVLSLMDFEAYACRMEHEQPQQAATVRRWLSDYVATAFADRTLPIDAQIAQRAAQLSVACHTPERISLLAATALTRHLVIATQAPDKFEALGVQVHNPWSH